MTYNDSKKEGVTRATIGEGAVTVGGSEDDKGINRDINKAQEVLIDEDMEVTVNVPIELITNPVKYIKESPERVKDFPNRVVNEITTAVNRAKEALPEGPVPTKLHFRPDFDFQYHC